MTDSQVEKEIDSVEQELIDAARRQDAAALDRIVADDFLITCDTMADKLGDKKLYLAECLASGTIEGGVCQLRQGESASVWKYRRREFNIQVSSYHCRRGTWRCISLDKSMGKEWRTVAVCRLSFTSIARGSFVNCFGELKASFQACKD
jgi:hypothetical protein